MMGQLHIVAAIVRFEFTLTEFLKSHIHVCPHVLTTDVCSLSILIVFLFFLPPSILLCILFAQFISYEAKKKCTKHILLSSIFMILSHDRKIQTIFLMIPRNPG